MTINQFKYLLQVGGILDSEDRDINICYTGSYLQAIAVRVAEGNLTQLQQATTLVIKAPQTGNTLNISLQNSQVPVRTVNREQIGNYYLYTIVEQNQQPIMTTIPSPTGVLPSEDYYTEVMLLPSSQGGNFKGSNYEVLLNNSLDSRTSNYLQVSDRAENSVNPVNLPSILVDNAILANIQDSMYSDTGWISGRYRGTKTDSSVYGGIEPALIGGTFKGAFFPQTYTEEQIRAQASTDIDYQDYFFTGKLDAPTCKILPQNNPFAWNPYDIPFDATKFTISIYDTSVKILPGDLITMQNGDFNINITEICKILSITSLNGSNTSLQLEVIRGFGGSPIYDYQGNISYGSSQAELYTITTNQIYSLQANRLQGLLAGKLLVKNSQELLYINSSGYTISGSKQ